MLGVRATMAHRGTVTMKRSNFCAALETRKIPLALIHLALLLGSVATLLLPFSIAWFGDYAYYVRGIDLIFGRHIPGDSFGMVPQTAIALAAVLILLALLAFFMRNWDKGVFLITLCNTVAFLLYCSLLLPQNGSQIKLNPVVAGLANHYHQLGYWLSLLLLGLGAVVGVTRILGQPGLRVDLIRHRWIYVMSVPVIIYVLIFFYYPMYGQLMAFKDYSPRLGILGSEWVGFDNFLTFFSSPYFGRLIRNTIVIGLLTLIFNFVTPILFALFLNEVTSSKVKRTVQTATYLPHFISLVVVCGLLVDFFSREGLVNQLLITLGMSETSAQNFLGDSRYYWFIYVFSDVWQNFGWGSIVYFAAITNVDPQLYESADLDGASRMRKMWNVTLPCIAPTAIVMLIMAVGNVMNVGYEKTILLYNSQTMNVADIISSYTYRMGIVDGDYGYATAVGLFNTVINFVLVLCTNKISRRVSETSLW